MGQDIYSSVIGARIKCKTLHLSKEKRGMELQCMQDYN